MLFMAFSLMVYGTLDMEAPRPETTTNCGECSLDSAVPVITAYLLAYAYGFAHLFYLGTPYAVKRLGQHWFR